MRTAAVLALLALFVQDEGFRREGDAKRREKLDKLEGKAAPKWEFEKWIQGETTQKELKGKVILVDFWGVW